MIFVMTELLYFFLIFRCLSLVRRRRRRRENFFLSSQLWYTAKITTEWQGSIGRCRKGLRERKRVGTRVKLPWMDEKRRQRVTSAVWQQSVLRKYTLVLVLWGEGKGQRKAASVFISRPPSLHPWLPLHVEAAVPDPLATGQKNETGWTSISTTASTFETVSIYISITVRKKKTPPNNSHCNIVKIKLCENIKNKKNYVVSRCMCPI